MSPVLSLTTPPLLIYFLYYFLCLIGIDYATVAFKTCSFIHYTNQCQQSAMVTISDVILSIRARQFFNKNARIYYFGETCFKRS